jgi:hypothetical protein
MADTQQRPGYEALASQALQEQEALASLRLSLAETLGESLRIHQRSLDMIASLKREVERVRQQLKRMGTAR